jgi:hypothetical protein
MLAELTAIKKTPEFNAPVQNIAQTDSEEGT